MRFKRLKFDYLQQFINTDEETGEEFLDYSESTKIIPVTPIKVKQITLASSTFADILNKVKEDDQIMETLKVSLGIVPEGMMDLETGELLGELKDRSVENWGQTLGFLLKELPDEIMDLLAIVTDIDREDLDQLETDQLFELLEAVVEVNNIEKLANAAQSFFTAITKKTDKAVQKAKADGKLKALNNKTQRPNSPAAPKKPQK